MTPCSTAAPLQTIRYVTNIPTSSELDLRVQDVARQVLVILTGPLANSENLKSSALRCLNAMQGLKDNDIRSATQNALSIQSVFLRNQSLLLLMFKCFPEDKIYTVELARHISNRTLANQVLSQMIAVDGDLESIERFAAAIDDPREQSKALENLQQQVYADIKTVSKKIGLEGFSLIKDIMNHDSSQEEKAIAFTRVFQQDVLRDDDPCVIAGLLMAYLAFQNGNFIEAMDWVEKIPSQQKSQLRVRMLVYVILTQTMKDPSIPFHWVEKAFQSNMKGDFVDQLYSPQLLLHSPLTMLGEIVLGMTTKKLYQVWQAKGNAQEAFDFVAALEGTPDFLDDRWMEFATIPWKEEEFSYIYRAISMLSTHEKQHKGFCKVLQNWIEKEEYETARKLIKSWAVPSCFMQIKGAIDDLAARNCLSDEASDAKMQALIKELSGCPEEEQFLCFKAYQYMLERYKVINITNEYAEPAHRLRWVDMISVWEDRRSSASNIKVWKNLAELIDDPDLRDTALRHTIRKGARSPKEIAELICGISNPEPLDREFFDAALSRLNLSELRSICQIASGIIEGYSLSKDLPSLAFLWVLECLVHSNRIEFAFGQIPADRSDDFKKACLQAMIVSAETISFERCKEISNRALSVCFFEGCHRFIIDEISHSGWRCKFVDEMLGFFLRAERLQEAREVAVSYLQNPDLVLENIAKKWADYQTEAAIATAEMIRDFSIRCRALMAVYAALRVPESLDQMEAAVFRAIHPDLEVVSSAWDSEAEEIPEGVLRVFAGITDPHSRQLLVLQLSQILLQKGSVNKAIQCISVFHVRSFKDPLTRLLIYQCSKEGNIQKALTIIDSLDEREQDEARSWIINLLQKRAPGQCLDVVVLLGEELQRSILVFMDPNIVKADISRFAELLSRSLRALPDERRLAALQQYVNQYQHKERYPLIEVVSSLIEQSEIALGSYAIYYMENAEKKQALLARIADSGDLERFYKQWVHLDLDKALYLAEVLAEKKGEWQALSEVALLYGRQGYVDKSLELLLRIPNSDLVFSVLFVIAPHIGIEQYPALRHILQLHSEGSKELALKMIKALPSSSERNLFHNDLMGLFLQEKQIDRAFEVAELMVLPPGKLHPLVLFAREAKRCNAQKELLCVGEELAAHEKIEAILSIARSFSIEERREFFREVLSRLRQREAHKAAEKMILALDSVEDLPFAFAIAASIPNNLEELPLQIRIALNLINKARIQEAIDLIFAISPYEDGISPLKKLVNNLAHRGEVSKLQLIAEKLIGSDQLESALLVLSKIENPLHDSLASQFCHAFLKRRQLDAALHMAYAVINTIQQSACLDRICSQNPDGDLLNKKVVEALSERKLFSQAFHVLMKMQDQTLHRESLQYLLQHILSEEEIDREVLIAASQKLNGRSQFQIVLKIIESCAPIEGDLPYCLELRLHTAYFVAQRIADLEIREQALALVAQGWVFVGEMETAIYIRSLIRSESLKKELLMHFISHTRTFRGLQKVSDIAQKESAGDDILEKVSIKHLEFRKPSSAKKIARGILEPTRRDEILETIQKWISNYVFS